MAFFKSLFKQGDSASRSGAFPVLHDGMDIEVLTPDGNRIFTGKLRLLPGGVLEVRTEAGKFPPRPVYDEQVTLRGVQDDGAAFSLDGSVTASGLDLWRIEKRRPAPTSIRDPENRDAFRQNTGMEGRIRTLSGQELPCKVLDVSAVGARVVTSKLFPLETAFHLETTLLPEEAPFFLTCRVKRILVRSKPGSLSKKFEYGCQFINVSSREQERLLRTIFALQRGTRFE